MSAIRKTRRIYILVILCFISFFLPHPALVKAEDAGDYLPSCQGHPIITGSFRYLSASSSDATDRFFYSDGYFEKSAVEYDPHLASMSLCLAGAAMSSNEGGTIDYQNKSCNARTLLDRIGCRDICVNTDFVVKPGEDTIGVVMGRKDITIDGKEYTLLPIGIRGAGYEKEWIGNMKIGTAGDAEGFSEAAERALSVVKEYIKNYEIDASKTKFWIAGFSRAGAVTDLLTRLLTDEYDRSGACVYGYSFAAPMAAYNPTSHYPNSHCTINREDAVPMVAPAYMGFDHYGEETALEGTSKGFKAYRIEVSYAVDLFSLSVPDDFTFVPVPDSIKSQQELVTRLMTALAATLAPDREVFAAQPIEGGTTLEEILSLTMRILMTSDSKQLEKLAQVIGGFRDRLGVGTMFDISDMVNAIRDGMDTLSEDERNEIYADLWSWLKPGLQEALPEDEFRAVGGMWKSLIYTVFTLAHFDYDRSGAEGFELIGTLMKNISSIGRAHTPDVYFSLVKKKDDFYRDYKSAPVESEGDFRIESCAQVDGVVYKNGTPVSIFKDGTMEASKDPSVVTALLSDAGSDLKPIAEGTLYTNSESVRDRLLKTDPTAVYQVELTAHAEKDGLVFWKWVDETGMPVTHNPTYTVLVDKGHTTRRRLKPVYILASALERNGLPESAGSGNHALIWVFSGLGAAALSGGGAFLYARRKRRAGPASKNTCGKKKNMLK